MAKYADRVKETTTTTGTGSITLAGAVTGFRRLQDAFSVGDYVRYEIIDANGSAWEGGYGELSSATVLTREFPIDSSDGAATKITLSTGTHTVLIGAAPEMIKTQGVLTSLGLPAGAPDVTWSDILISGVVASNPPYYDTEGVIPSPPTTYTSLSIPNWVSKIRINAQIDIAEHAGGRRSFGIFHLDNSLPTVGMPLLTMPSITDATNTNQTLKISSGVIDVPDSGGRGIKVRLYQNSGVTLDVAGTYSWLNVEFVE